MGKTVLITGTSSGIGKATAKRFAKEGYNIVIHYYMNEDGATELSSYLEEKYRVKTFLYKCDISNEDEIIDMVDYVEEKFYKIDVLINNAALTMDMPFEEKTASNFKKVLSVNLVGPFTISKYLGFKMRNRENGVIINVTSTNGIDTYYPEAADYDASKAGLISLTHNLAVALSPYVRVNAVAPGWVDTPFIKENVLDEYRSDEEKKIFMKRFGKDMEIANVIYFLASDEASYISNEIIRVDGGSYHG